MKLAVIAPPSYISLSRKYSDDCLLVLAHWLEESEEYKDAVTETKTKCKILDNSAAEGKLVSDINKLIDLAYDVGANEVVIPDYFMDYSRSFASVERNYPIIKNEGLKPFVVLQGMNFGELMRFWVSLEEKGYNEGTIGFGNEVFLRAIGGIQPRNKFLYRMMGEYDFVYDYDIHYLGYSTLYDWIYHPTIVRSTDSGIFLKAAIQGLDEIPFRHMSGVHLDVNVETDSEIRYKAEKFIIEMKDRIIRGI